MESTKRANEFFWEHTTPRKPLPTNSEHKELTAEEIQARNKFFSRDLLTILWQGPIKKSIIRKNNKDEEPLTPEMEAEIREIFGENSRPHNQKTE
jgi:hypothetical protein